MKQSKPSRLSTLERAKWSALLAFVGIPLVGNLWIPVQMLWPDAVFMTLNAHSETPFEWRWYVMVWMLGQKVSPIFLAWSAYVNPGRQYIYIWLSAALYFVIESLETFMVTPGLAKELMAPAYMLLCYLVFWLAPAPERQPKNNEQKQPRQPDVPQFPPAPLADRLDAKA